jgi:hypothetical protein
VQSAMEKRFTSLSHRPLGRSRKYADLSLGEIDTSGGMILAICKISNTSGKSSSLPESFG